jgi:hypothetical protein
MIIGYMSRYVVTVRVMSDWLAVVQEFCRAAGYGLPAMITGPGRQGRTLWYEYA